MKRIVLSREALDFLIDVSNAGPSGMLVRPDADGAPEMPASVVRWTYDGAWRAHLTVLGRGMIEALRRKDAKGAA